MKKELEEREMFPVYCLYDGPDRLPVEVSDELMKRYKTAWEEWLDVQDILSKLYEDA